MLLSDFVIADTNNIQEIARIKVKLDSISYLEQEVMSDINNGRYAAKQKEVMG